MAWRQSDSRLSLLEPLDVRKYIKSPGRSNPSREIAPKPTRCESCGQERASVSKGWQCAFRLCTDICSYESPCALVVEMTSGGTSWPERQQTYGTYGEHTAETTASPT